MIVKTIIKEGQAQSGVHHRVARWRNVHREKMKGNGCLVILLRRDFAVLAR